MKLFGVEYQGRFAEKTAIQHVKAKSKKEARKQFEFMLPMARIVKIRQCKQYEPKTWYKRD